MTTALLLGLLAGIRHTLEPDHLAAVASLGRHRAVGPALRRGVAWGAGHSTTLLVFGGGSLLLGRAIPEGWATVLDGFGGLLLVLLGADVLRRLARRHRQPLVPVHAAAVPHDHVPRHGRALWVGALHGLAGSGAVVVLVPVATSSPLVGLAWIVLFALGSVTGMAAMSALMAVPFTLAAPRIARVAVLLELLVGLGTVLVGARLLSAQLA
jgi:hypothetical protein